MVDFFEFSNEMLCLANLHGYFTQVNQAWTRVLGWTAEELTSKPYLEFIHPDDLAATIQEASRLESSKYETIQFENRYRCRDGSYRWLAWYARLVPELDRLVAAARDVTEQKQQSETLRTTAERLQLVLDATNDAIWDVDLLAGTVWWNDVYDTRFGPRPKETTNSWEWWTTRIHPQDCERVVSTLKDLIAGDGWKWSADYRFRRSNGRYAHVLDRAIVTRDSCGRAVRALGAMQDVTALRQDEEELRRQASTIRDLFELQERERKLVSLDIHDGLAQMIIGAYMAVQSAQASPAESTPLLEKAQIALSRAIKESRRLINDLRPLIIDERGIPDSIRHLVAEQSKESDCRFDMSIHVLRDQIDPLFDGVVFRIIQEAIANALRHGQASKIRLRVEQEGDRLELEIQDNGRGFDPEQIPADRLGVRGIIERAKIFGGTARWQSHPGSSTTVRVRLTVPGWSGDP